MIWKLVIAYDGTAFHGWQWQEGHRTVQGEVKSALERLFGGPVSVHGASRTDRGVHALGQVAHVVPPDTARAFRSFEVWMGVNAHLPPDVRVMRVARAPAGFHAQYRAKGKRYRYRILNARVMPPLEIGRAWQVPLPLDVERMRAAARHLLGTHDFQPYAVNSRTVRENTVRTLTRVDVVRRGDRVDLVVEGDGFLYRMVRSLAGALVQVGLGNEPDTFTRDRLHERKRTRRVVTAPPGGLYLEKVFY